MPIDPTTSAPPVAQRDAAYTTPRPDIFELVPSTARDVLDVGCSNGALGRSLKQALPGRQVSGIEFDASFAKEASEHLDRVVHADVNVLDWRATMGESRFDCIVFADVLEHLIDPQRCLAHARQQLRPGGCIVISLPNIRHLSSIRAIFVGGRFPRRDRGIFDRTHLRWFTIADANELVTASGLRVAAFSQALRWGDRGGGRVNRLLNRLPLAVQRFGPIREFLTYQICLRAEVMA